MRGTRTNLLSRRHLLKASGSAALLAGVAPGIIPSRARAQQKTLKIMQWKHFVPGYDTWFDETFIKEWGKQHDTEVIVDHVGLGDITSRAKAEAEAQRGHDLVMLLTPTAVYEDQVIDHREIYEECERRYGTALDLAIKSTYNPRTKKYFGFCGAFIPPLLIYRKDLWDAIGAAPDSWDDILHGGRQIKLLHESPVGISLAPEPNSNYALRAVMYSFGASVQDADGKPVLKSKPALEMVKYVKALYQEAMTEEVLAWDASSNNRFLLAGTGCLTVDTISIPRASEQMKLPFASDLRLAQAPEGPASRLAIWDVLTHFIWKFAENAEGARQFLVDYTGQSRQGLLAGGFENMPSFPADVPDLAQLVSSDAGATPPGQYSLLKEVATWTTNIGYPGYTNAAIAEVFGSGVIPTMCARAATGKLSPEDALDQGDQEVRRIFAKWRERGKV
jgi:multiple sugar transport system substrate-binding protein